MDRRAIEALGDALAGSRRHLVITSGTGMGSAAPGQPATEDHFDPNHPNPRAASEFAAEAVAARGVSVSVVRLPQVHNTEKQGLVTPAIAVAREKRVAAYVGDGQNRWPAVHLLDAAPVYRLALEKGTARARYHAVAEQGVPARQIAEAIGRGLKTPVISMSPEQAAGHFGWLNFFAGMDMPASSALTHQRRGWHHIELHSGIFHAHYPSTQYDATTHTVVGRFVKEANPDSHARSRGPHNRPRSGY